MANLSIDIHIILCIVHGRQRTNLSLENLSNMLKQWAIDAHYFVALQEACMYLSLMSRHGCFLVYAQTF